MCLTNIHMRDFFFQCNFFSQNQQKTEKKIFGLKKMNLLEWLQNLKQHSRPIGALCGKKFDYESQPFGRYGFPRVLQFFDTRTVTFYVLCFQSRAHDSLTRFVGL